MKIAASWYDTHMAPAVIVFEVGVDALGTAAGFVMFGAVRFQWPFFAAARVGIHDGDAALGQAVGLDGGRIVGGVFQVVKYGMGAL